jgi:hypothetical protein
MINVYQINFTDEQVDEINDPSTPEPDYYKAFLKTIFDADVYQAWNMGLYEHVADVSTDCFDTAFAVMNRWNPVDEKLVRRYAKTHSMSVGDIVVNKDLAPARYPAYAVARVGFSPLNLKGIVT